MDTPDDGLQILLDALIIDGKPWEEAMHISAIVSSSEIAMLDMAVWVAKHPNSSRQEMVDKAVRLLEESMKS